MPPRPFKKSRISAQEIIDRYVAGEGRGSIALRAKIPEARVLALLKAHNIPIRTSAQANRLWREQRNDWYEQFGRKPSASVPTDPLVRCRTNGGVT